MDNYASMSNDNQKIISSDITSEELNKKAINKNANPISKNNETKSDKTQIMTHVTFVLSGFLNPLRAELRNKAVAMGATYNDDWNPTCTHLISAFANTPKFHEARQTGKGVVVSKHWILDCYKQNQLLPEKSYELTDKNDKDGSQRKSQTNKRKEKTEEEDRDTAQTTGKTPSRTKNANKKQNTFGEIPDIFHGKHFYVSYGDYDDNTLLDIARIILAYDGTLERQITSDVKYVITNRMWNQDFAKISKSNPDINFVTLDWLQDCHDANKFMPMQPYLVVP